MFTKRWHYLGSGKAVEVRGCRKEKRIMSELFNDLVTGLNEAIAFEKGQGKGRTHTFIIEPVKRYSKSEIKTIRTNAGMTQAEFANYMGVSSKTVEAWEKGTNHPTGPACRLLDILSSDCIKDMPFIKHEDVKKRIESNLLHLETIMQDVKDGKAHFAEHDLIDED